MRKGFYAALSGIEQFRPAHKQTAASNSVPLRYAADELLCPDSFLRNSPRQSAGKQTRGFILDGRRILVYSRLPERLATLIRSPKVPH